jgi:cytoskeletal protein RodZ
MTAAGPPSQPPPGAQDAPATPEEPAGNPAVQRAARMNAANMVRSLLPLVLICLAIVWWTNFRQSADVQPVRTVDPTSTIDLAANRASYPLVVPQGLSKDYRPTSARTDAGRASEGDPVTLEIGYVTPSDEFAGFVVSDDRRADPVAAVLDKAVEKGSVDVRGRSWTRSTSQKGETVLSLEEGGAIVTVSGSASEKELETVAGAVAPFRQ